MIGQGASLIIFPEGTRSRDGKVGRFKGGVFLLAIESGLPLCRSVCRHTSRDAQGRLMTCPGDVTLTVHAPISTAGMTRENARSLAAQVQAVVSEAAS
jgi:1-acyl-sn-glycerol-3-phosphate acyltransferase